jgi:phage terminase large subunit
MTTAELDIQEVVIKRLPKYDILYNLPVDTNLVICIGGRGGAKTYEVSKKIIFDATINRKRSVILRDERERIKESILNEIFMRYDTANKDGLLDKYYDKNETELKDKQTGKTLIYTQGFRASDKQKKANLKGSSDVDNAVIEEAEDIRDKDKFFTFWDGMRKEGAILYIMLNTPDINHWIVKTYFNAIPVDDGYFELHPKQVKGFVCIQTTYKDNPFLPEHIRSRYEAYGDKNSPLYNKFYYMTAIKGYASTGRKGQILTKVKPISLQEYLALPYREFFGQDFGVSAPAGMVGVKFDRNNCYCREINYKGMSVLNIGKMYCTLNFNVGDKIIADHADPEWTKLKNGFPAIDLSNEDRIRYPQLVRGFYVVGCEKGAGSIKYGLSLMDSLNLYAVEESTNLWDEIYKYIWEQDKNGNYTDNPIDEYNHLIDPWRYVVMDQRGKNKAFGI